LEDGSIPVYRHPMDQLPTLIQFTPIVNLLRQQAEKILNQHLNHVLIQYYRSGNDYISEHADKTLDIQKGTNIVGVNLGAMRTMIVKEKMKGENRIIERVPLPHNSVFVIGWNTNLHFLHSIKQDKRISTIKSYEETAYNSERISLTFRTVATFQHPQGFLYGQGAKHKSLNSFQNSSLGREEKALTVTTTILSVGNDKNSIVAKSNNTQDSDYNHTVKSWNDEREDIEHEKLRMLAAFSAENRDPNFDWDEHYGEGFDIIM
jgi:alkylated DNA repair dioxygenase AlkB